MQDKAVGEQPLDPIKTYMDDNDFSPEELSD
jgi:hypothetical protein